MPHGVETRHSGGDALGGGSWADRDSGILARRKQSVARAWNLFCPDTVGPPGGYEFGVPCIASSHKLNAKL